MTSVWLHGINIMSIHKSLASLPCLGTSYIPSSLFVLLKSHYVFIPHTLSTVINLKIKFACFAAKIKFINVISEVIKLQQKKDIYIYVAVFIKLCNADVAT